jgi:hypothetical protein
MEVWKGFARRARPPYTVLGAVVAPLPAPRLTFRGRSVREAVPDRPGAKGRRPAAGPTEQPTTPADDSTTAPRAVAGASRDVQNLAILPTPIEFPG